MGSCVFLRPHRVLVRGTCIHRQPKLLGHSTCSWIPRPQPSHRRDYPSRRPDVQDPLASRPSEITGRRKQLHTSITTLPDGAPLAPSQ